MSTTEGKRSEERRDGKKRSGNLVSVGLTQVLMPEKLANFLPGKGEEFPFRQSHRILRGIYRSKEGMLFTTSGKPPESHPF